jgi:hypothetical protein
MSGFKVESKQSSESLKLSFSGVLNEQASIQDFDFARHDLIEIDLQNVSAINSVGVRTWLGFAKKLPSNKKVVFKNIPKIWADQCNMIKGFIPEPFFIESVEVPYFCEACEKVTKTMIPASQIDSVKSECSCSHCKKTAVLDVLLEPYFKFLKNRA